MASGTAKKLLKTFNRTDIPTTMFVIFCNGGIDFVGGFTYYQLLKNNLFEVGGESSLVSGT
jgi:hypothetical protein